MDIRHDPLYRIAYIRFKGDLRDFTNDSVSDNIQVARFKGKPSLKDTIESLGVPQVEIGKTEKDEEIIALDSQLHGGEWISVFPKKYVYQDEELKSANEMYLPTPPGFILDGHLGKLAVKMRMAGIDTDYETQRSDDRIVAEAVQQNRVVLTRDIGLLKHKKLLYGRWIRNDQPLDQWIEVMLHFRLWLFVNSGIRCTHCNTILADVAFEEVADKLPKLVRERKPEIKQCPACKHLYWRGTHYRNFMDELKYVIKRAKNVSYR